MLIVINGGAGGCTSFGGDAGVALTSDAGNTIDPGDACGYGGIVGQSPVGVMIWLLGISCRCLKHGWSTTIGSTPIGSVMCDSRANVLSIPLRDTVCGSPDRFIEPALSTSTQRAMPIMTLPGLRYRYA